MSSLLGFIVPPLVGGVIGLTAMFGLVATQTGAPDHNPAQKAPISYGQ